MRVLAATVLLLGASCVTHLSKNANGTAVLEQPAAPVPDTQTRPIDPGENLLVVSAGGFFGVGARAGEGSSNGTSEAGVEISIDVGVNEKSHVKPDLLPMVVPPKRRYGVNLGFVIFETTASDFREGEVGPLYLEAHYVELIKSVSVGYSIDPKDKSHGPQVALSAYGVYAKSSYRFGRGFDAVLGFVFKFPGYGIAWSR